MAKANTSRSSGATTTKRPAAKVAPAMKKASTIAKRAAVKTVQAAAIPAPAGRAAEKPQKVVQEPKEKAKKAKLVRDSFTMPEAEYAALGEVKKACLKAGVEVKKSELLRIGVALVRQLDIAKLKEIRESLPALKAGRPKKNK